MKKIFIKSLRFLFLFSMIVLLSSSGGGNKGNKKPPSGSEPERCNIRITQLMLYQGNINPGASIPQRSPSYYGLQEPTPFSGHPSATSMYSDIQTKHYTFVTIVANCSNYGDNGTKTYVWNPSSQSSNIMNIEVPSDMSFNLTVDFHEKCGPFYSGSNPYKRAVWVHQGTYSPSPSIAVSTWLFNRLNNC